MAKRHPMEIMFKALIFDYAHERNIDFERVWETPLNDYVAYLQQEYPTDQRLFSKLPQRELLESWWDDEVGNTDWLLEHARSAQQV
jgi:hypothetical protein